MYAAAGGASIARRQDRRKVAKSHVVPDTVHEQIDKRFAALQDQFAPGHGAPPGILASASRLPSYLELNGKFGFGSTDLIEGKATSAWTGERRLTSPSEDLERTCKVKQTEAHRRWMKRNRIQDSSFGGGSSSDEEDHLNSGKHHLYIQQQNTLINLLLYIGLCIISLGLIISFVGTGEKGFKTNELRLIGPCLLLVGGIFCGLRVLFCFCRVNNKFCMKKSHRHHQKMIKSQSSKPAKIISKQMQQMSESSQHHVGLIDHPDNSNVEFYKYLPFHNRKNDFVSEPMTKSSDFDGRKRVSIIPPSKSQSSELNKTLMFSPNQPMPYSIPTMSLPKTTSNTTHLSDCSTRKEEQSNLIDLSYTASMHDLLSLSSVEDEMEADVEDIDKLSINSETMKQLKSTIITLDNKDNKFIEHINVIKNSCEDLNYIEHNFSISNVDINKIESNDFSLISSDVIKYSSCDKKCDNGKFCNKSAIEQNQITNHDRTVSDDKSRHNITNNNDKNKVIQITGNDSALEPNNKEPINVESENHSDPKMKQIDAIDKARSIIQDKGIESHPKIIFESRSNDSVMEKSLRDTMAINVSTNDALCSDHVVDNKGTVKKLDERENKPNNTKETKTATSLDKVKTNVNSNMKTNSIMKDSKTNIGHNKASKLNLLDGKDLKTALNRNNMKNSKANSANKKVNFTTPNSKNSIELIETHKKYNKSDCISLNEKTESILNSNSIQANEHELVLNPLNLKSTSKS